MKKFFAFCSKFAGVILMTIGVVAGILWAIQSGVAINDVGAWSDPSKDVKSIVGFSIAISGFALIIVFGFLSLFAKKLKVLATIGKYIILTIAIVLVLGLTIQSGIWLTENGSWTSFKNDAAKASIGIFSIGVILLTMNILFGIFSIGANKKQHVDQY